MDRQVETNREPGDRARLACEADPRAELAAAELRIKELETQLAAQARARCELIHLVSHELRTPITVLSGFARLMQNSQHGELNPEQRRFSDEILKACRRLDHFVIDLLEASPHEDTPFPVELCDADLHETLGGQLESLAPMLEDRGIKVEARLYADTTTMPFDERRIEQVITNLMTNAIRYGRPSGVIRIATESGLAGEVGSPADRIEVSIEDDGPGIPEADRERLFAPYVRGEQGESSPENSGLGIGLAISRRIILAHGGRIWVESGELGGARFVFNLPRTRCAGGEE